MDSLLKFIFNHNTAIIEVLIALTALAALFLSFRSFMTQDSGGAMGGDFSKLEETLKKLLEKAGTVTANAPSGASAAAGTESGNLLAEISTLKTELEDKKKMIDEIQKGSADGKTAAAGISAEDKSKLEAKIKELEGKLSEYEIISEDIADLSKYKEQNVKLKAELEDLKKNQSAAPAAVAPAPAAVQVAAAPAEAPAAVQVTTAPPVQAVTPAAVAPAAVQAATAPPVQAAAPAASAPPVQTAPVPQSAPAAGNDVSSLVDDDLMKEFAAAVENQKKVGSEQPASTAASPQQAAAPEGEIDLGAMDVDKMAAEAAKITDSSGPEISFEEAVGTNLNEDKLLAEASGMEGPALAEEKKLLGQFEDYVKKNQT
jgi:hypothetical protein